MFLKRLGLTGLIAAVCAMSILGGCVQQEPVELEEVTEQQEPVQVEIEDEETEGETAESEASQEESVKLFEYLSDADIDSANAMSIIEMLASEKFEGRKAGMETGHLAEDYVAELFAEIGLESPESLDGYKHKYPQKIIYPVQPSELSIVGSDEVFEYQLDFTERNLIGRSYHDADLTAEMIVVERVSDFNKEASEFNDKVLLVNQDIFYGSNLWERIDKLQNEGANIEGVMVSMEIYGSGGMTVSRSLRGDENDTFDENDPFVMHVSSETYEKLSVASSEGNEVKVKLDFEVENTEPANIVGVIPGKNEDGENETLIIGAHMDHVGNNLNGTYNPGALDNASGVATMLEIARIVKETGQPENTIVFVAFNGEEDGLRGARYFVENPPVEYDKSTTKMLNFDMVGSKIDAPLELTTPDQVSFEMRRDIAEIAKMLDMHSRSRSSGGSDHIPFSQAGIPSVLIIQFDDTYYHTYMDTPENAVSEERLEEIIRLGLAYVDQEAYQDN